MFLQSVPTKSPSFPSVHNLHLQIRFILFVVAFLSCLKNVVVGNEVRIANESCFHELIDDVNIKGISFSGTTVFLDSDLSLSEVTEPLGYSSGHQFHDVLDGQGHVISNLKMTSSSQYVGLFGYSRGLITQPLRTV